MTILRCGIRSFSVFQTLAQGRQRTDMVDLLCRQELAKIVPERLLGAYDLFVDRIQVDAGLLNRLPVYKLFRGDQEDHELRTMIRDVLIELFQRLVDDARSFPNAWIAPVECAHAILGSENCSVLSNREDLEIVHLVTKIPKRAFPLIRKRVPDTAPCNMPERVHHGVGRECLSQSFVQGALRSWLCQLGKGFHVEMRLDF